MTPQFTRRFRVRHYELDVFGRVNPVAVVHYMQEAAIEASAALGFSPDWYREHGTGWVVRRLSVRHYAPLAYGDEVEVGTWISGMGGVRSTREYDLRVGGAPVARGRAEWVYVEARTGQPARIPDEWARALPGGGGLEDLGVRPADHRPTEGAHRYTSRRRVQFHELDTARHVNHAVYLHWTAQAYFDAVGAAGHPPERMLEEGWTAARAGHEVQYFGPALAGENIRVVSWVSETGRASAAWTHEVYNADTGKLLARDYSPLAFVDREGKPAAPPARAMEDLLRGPAGAPPGAVC